jgi:hypothetical protein
MLDALFASLNGEVGPRCNLWIFQERWIQPGAARNQQVVEHERTLSRPKLLPKSSAVLRAANQFERTI